MAAFLTPGITCLRSSSHLPLKLYSNSIRCAPLAPGPAHRQHHVTYSPRWTSSPLRSSLSFWYTHRRPGRASARWRLRDLTLEPHQPQFDFTNVVEQERVARCERGRSSVSCLGAHPAASRILPHDAPALAQCELVVRRSHSTGS